MQFAFQKMRLEAEGFFDLINTWAEMQLVVTKDSATIIGDGYAYEIAKAFTLLVFDWEAAIPLDRAALDIPEGSYDLIRDEDKNEVHACRGERYYVLHDRPVRVEVVSVPEED